MLRRNLIFSSILISFSLSELDFFKYIMQLKYWETKLNETSGRNAKISRLNLNKILSTFSTPS
ncbi:hypothetical protein XELAEV_18047542mg [Xenopus laevis]|uniref:Uncharacterized protein n=1 Tax=Xenopus laevis TaxID=8355 RepID=A0A974BW10_XENLA|nr:hypothetical protein XELAEV_18047542mg [Xenopus laevis]